MEKSGNTYAGGCLIALGVMGGVIWGAYERQLSIGFLAGLGIGVALALLLWLIAVVRR